MVKSCSKCGTTPCIKRCNVTVYIAVGADHLLDKLEMILKRLDKSTEVKERHFICTIKDMEEFIRQLAAEVMLSSVERDDIYVLPKESEEIMDFGDFSDVKSLTYWIRLFENKDIIDAIDKGRITTWFQPIVYNRTMELYGREALSRAYDEDGELIMPDRLFTISKELDLLFNLDRQCRIAAIENGKKAKPLGGKLFINFIPTVIYDPKVCLITTHEAVAESQLRPEDIVFEVVESEFVEDYEHLATILNAYREKGYKTALDDIGSGFSTLAAFDKLKTDYIKVDRSIIQNIHKSTSNQAYLDQVLALKKNHDVMIIAEGIETQEEYDYLRTTEVDLLQGYYCGKPQPFSIGKKK